MKLSFDIDTDTLLIGCLSSSAIIGITIVAALQSDLNVTCIATAGIAFIAFITLSLYNVTPITKSDLRKQKGTVATQ